MKNGINKSAKRVLSIALALMMLLGSVFIANNFDAKAQDGTVFWTGGTDTTLSGSGTAEDPYLITNAEELAALAQGKLNLTKHYKVSGVTSFYIVPDYYKDVIDSFASAEEVRSFLSSDFDDIARWTCSGTFEGVLDGNGATVYGLSISGTGVSGLLQTAKGATVKNLGIEKSYINTTGNAGAFFGQGNWNLPDTAAPSPKVTIQNCVVKNCYIVGAARGAFIGNAGYSELLIDNCLAADNYIGTTSAADAYPSFAGGSDTATKYGVNVPAVISNCIAIGLIPKAGDVNAAAHKQIVNCYNTLITYSVANVDLKKVTANELKGISAKTTASTLNWATDTQNGAGYWHVSATDYPTPLKPTGWSDIIVHPVWNGTAATSFAGGSGTEKDPYIIKTAEQLYKMVLDAGREETGTKLVKKVVGVTDANGNMLDNSGAITTDAAKQAYKYSDETIEVPAYRNCYYKVADDVTDIYLNSVQGGDLNTLKALVSAGTAKVWNKAYNGANEKTDNDGDGFYDEKSAFRGVFDGNGVTIHGLYTNKAAVTSWLAYGDGFFPAIKGDAVIKNVTFDKSYINPAMGYGAVVSASIGLDSLNNTPEGYANKGALGDNCGTTNATFANIAIRNTYIAQGGYSTNVAKGDYNKAGILAAHGSPKKLTFINCLYDGTGSELVYDTNDNTAGIYMAAHTASTATLINCVSIGLQPVACSTQDSKAKFVNTYTTVAKENFHSKNSNDDVTVITEYDSQDDLPLLNWGVWSINTVEDGRKLPMPKLSNGVIAGYSTVKEMVLQQVGGAGLFSYNGAYEKGTYGHYDKLIGSGTEADPYLISTPIQLANAIATGGKSVTQKLYYKLTNDINLGSLAWIDTDTVTRESEGFDEYRYTPFEGVLDGNGYTIYELNATAENSGALIPELNGGTVKNLHIRNSAANTAIFAKGTGTIDNCSAINCYVTDADGSLVTGGATVKNSVFNDKYYLADGTEGTPVLDGVTWYGIAGKKPHLVNNAKTMPYADVDGDGIGDAYGATDLVALKNALLKKQDYKYVYGDVNSDGKINSGDLVALIRATANDYNHVKDGFWRNIELGNFSIYYGENDNYDAARKLELYLEAAVPGIDIKKVVSAENTVTGSNADKTAVYVHSNDTIGTPDGKLEIIVGNIANTDIYATNTKATASNSYAITYDKENGVLWLQGENFTAVEQAVLDFINNSEAKTSTVYTVDTATLSSEKQPVTINGTTYYYTWGDEFNADELNEDSWLYSQMGSETAYEKGNAAGKYVNLENAFNKDLSQLYVIENGRLTIKRGAYTSSDANLGVVTLDAPEFGNADYIYNEQGNKVDKDDIYVSAGDILSDKSLLVKQGYFEFKASLPSDGHAFMSWWMMGAPTGGNNNAYTESLYGKVYKLNPHYTGINKMDSNNPSTYKYQLPNSYFEIDIIELLQDITNLPTDTIYSDSSGSSVLFNESMRNSWMTGVYDYDLPFNIHKYFDTGLVDGKYYSIDWSSYNSDPNNYTAGTGYTANGSENHEDGILSKRLGSHDFGNSQVTGYTGTPFFGSLIGGKEYTYNDMKYSATAHELLTKERKYGFEWKVTTNNNGVGQSFSYTIYIYDYDGKGNTKSYTYSNIDYNELSQLSDLNNMIPDAEIANQYMHFIIDNIYYVANQYNGNANFTDLLNYNNTDKTTLDIDYLRVYQQDGRRDIITPETEAFNNGNHFGY